MPLRCLQMAVIILASARPAYAADLQMDGFSYIRAKNFSKALDSFNAALKEQPNSWQILQSIGNCHMRLGHYETAVTYLQKSIEAGGLHASQCTIMAASLEGLGQPKKALSWLKLACSVDPTKAVEPGMQAAIRRLEDPAVNPTGSPNAPNYLSGLTSVTKWRQQDMPLKVYVRSNYQIPQFHEEFIRIVRGSLDQWCQATGNALSYKLVQSPDSANLVWDYTDRRELCTSEHEPGLEGAIEMKIHADDNTPAAGNIVILVKDGPHAPSFRDRVLISKTSLHEAGHALGMHGHSPNTHDVMFLAATPEPIAKLSERDKNTIKRIYQH